MIDRKKIDYVAFLIVALGMLFYAYEYSLRVLPSVQVHYYSMRFGLNAKQFADFAAIYYISYTPLQLVVGTFVDFYGSRRILLFALFACLFGTALIAYDHAIWLSILGRFIIGAGSAYAFVIVLKLAREWLPNDYFPYVANVTTSVGMLGAMCSQTLLFYTIQSIGMVPTLWILTLVGVLLWSISFYFVKQAPFTTDPEKSQWLLVAHSLGHVISNPQIWLTGLIGAAMFMPIVIFSDLWAPVFFEQVDHIPHAIAGPISSITYAGFIIGSPILGWLASHLQVRRVLLSSGSLIACAIISLILYWQTDQYWILGILMFLLGFSISAQPLVFAVANDNVKPEHLGTAIALTNLLVMLSGFLQDYVGSVLHQHGQTVAAFNSESFRQALLVMPCALLLLFTALLCFFMREKKP